MPSSRAATNRCIDAMIPWPSGSGPEAESLDRRDEEGSG